MSDSIVSLSKSILGSSSQDIVAQRTSKWLRILNEAKDLISNVETAVNFKEQHSRRVFESSVEN